MPLLLNPLLTLAASMIQNSRQRNQHGHKQVAHQLHRDRSVKRRFASILLRVSQTRAGGLGHVVDRRSEKHSRLFGRRKNSVRDKRIADHRQQPKDRDAGGGVAGFIFVRFDDRRGGHDRANSANARADSD